MGVLKRFRLDGYRFIAHCVAMGIISHPFEVRVRQVKERAEGRYLLIRNFQRRGLNERETCVLAQPLSGVLRVTRYLCSSST